MKHVTYAIAATTLLGMLTIPVHEAYALIPVYCHFTTKTNEVRNVKALCWTIRRKMVRHSEYNRLIEMGEVPARVAGDLGERCQLNHPENTRIDVTFDKVIYRLDGIGRIPNCIDLGAMAECRGEEWECEYDSDTDVDRDAIISSTDPATVFNPSWGSAGDLSVGGDFDRDGRGDRAIFRPSNSTWYFDYDFDNSTDHRSGAWGVRGDLPIAGDFDSDGHRDDIGVFRSSNRTWYYDHNHDGTTDESYGPWAVDGDLPIVGDFDRDGRYDDIAVFRSSNRTWYYDFNHDGTTDKNVSGWAVSGDMPYAGDFDRDGKDDDVGVYRQSSTSKYIDLDHNGSTDGTGRSGTGRANCLPVVITEHYSDHIWLFCNGEWFARDPDSAY